MHGRLFTLFDLPFPSYFVLLVTGFIVATAMGVLWARRLGHDPDVIVDLGISMLIAGVLGARIAHVLFDGFFWDYVHLCTAPARVAWKISEAECVAPIPKDWLFGGDGAALGAWDSAARVCHPTRSDCFAWARFWQGGLTYYGGFLGASAAAYYQLRRDRFPFWRAADMAGLVVPIGLGFGRLGCLLAGCCFGLPSSLPWGLRFPSHSPASEKQALLGLVPNSAAVSVSVHPTQIYEAGGCLLLATALLLWLHGRKRYDGQVFFAFVAGYAILRFVLEWLRSDDRGGLLGLSTSQWIGVLLILAAGLGHGVLLARQARRQRVSLA